MGESCIDRVTTALGCHSTCTIITDLVTSYLTDDVREGSGGSDVIIGNQWKRIYVALVVISNYIEISIKMTNKSKLQLYINSIIQTFINYINYPHIRVKNIVFYGITVLFQNCAEHLFNIGHSQGMYIRMYVMYAYTILYYTDVYTMLVYAYVYGICIQYT